MGEIVEEIVKDAGGVITEVYKDGLSQSVKPIGTMLSYLPRTVRLALAKWEKWIVNGEESLRLTGEALKDKVDKIPDEKLCEPEPYVAVPAIQQISYCYDSADLREMYANLLASSMNIDKKWTVHPSFVDIIKQITPDEAKLLNIFPKDSFSSVPLVDVKIVFSKMNDFITYAKNILPDKYYDICDNPDNMRAYINNLERLKIIHIPAWVSIVDNDFYSDIEKSERIKKIKEQVVLSDEQHYELVKRLFCMTDFGIAFVKCCIEG
ncbi:DUF4393 domain-containing protein [Pseudobutyrivibrio sp.]|uniref:DUF4393 domain-containing protein n=1 Tax=Pseudobutyrivibrio sp. TaxID=2014367 RepID=UPI001E18B1A8|nr:DUF4393 domain-containing protein [Pseudobutyrivibrio sp.]MBE5910121.1 DUF4393 domain-containing protein [Pseudobutyrivibrio sp.]